MQYIFLPSTIAGARARSWEANTGTQRAGKDWSAHRIILAIVLFAVGMVGFIDAWLEKAV